MQVEETYPLLRAKNIMKMTGHASLAKTTGNCELLGFNKNSGMKMSLMHPAIQMFFGVNIGVKYPAITLPRKSPRLKSTKKTAQIGR